MCFFSKSVKIENKIKYLKVILSNFGPYKKKWLVFWIFGKKLNSKKIYILFCYFRLVQSLVTIEKKQKKIDSASLMRIALCFIILAYSHLLKVRLKTVFQKRKVKHTGEISNDS